MATIELVDEQIDAIVVQELQIALESILDKRNIKDFYIDPIGVQKMVDGLKEALKYFMISDQYDFYMRELAILELTAESQIEGHYSELENFNRKPEGS